jgi:hypothetical protein
VARAAVDRPDFAEDYCSRALEMIRRTLRLLRPEDRLAFWRDKVLPDPALAPIRTDAAFKRIGQELVHPR